MPRPGAIAVQWSDRELEITTGSVVLRKHHAIFRVPSSFTHKLETVWDTVCPICPMFRQLGHLFTFWGHSWVWVEISSRCAYQFSYRHESRTICLRMVVVSYGSKTNVYIIHILLYIYIYIYSYGGVQSLKKLDIIFATSLFFLPWWPSLARSGFQGLQTSQRPNGSLRIMWLV